MQNVSGHEHERVEKARLRVRSRGTDSRSPAGSRLERQLERRKLLFSWFATLFPSKTKGSVLDALPGLLRWSVFRRGSAHLQEVSWDRSQVEG